MAGAFTTNSGVLSFYIGRCGDVSKGETKRKTDGLEAYHSPRYLEKLQNMILNGIHGIHA